MSEHQADSSKPEGQEFTPAVAFAMGEIKGTVENLRTDLREWKGDLTGSIAAGDAANALKIADQETRIRALEKWKWMIAGAAGAGGLAGGKFLDWLSKVSQ